MSDLSNPITADGDYEIKLRPGHEHSVTVGGTWGSGTATLLYKNSVGNFIAYEDFSLTADGGKKVFVPSPGEIRVTIAGSTNPSLTVETTKQQ